MLNVLYTKMKVSSILPYAVPL